MGSDIVSASTTKNQSEITLIDPFQLVDYRTKIIPDHLYPKFRLHLDKFKTKKGGKIFDSVQTKEPVEIDITQEEAIEPVEIDISQEETMETGNERIAKAMDTPTPSEIDSFIRKMMQNQKPEEIAFPADLRDIRKPKSFNKRQEKSKKSTSKYSEPTTVLKQIEYIPPISDQPEEEYANPSQVQPEKITKQNKRKK